MAKPNVGTYEIELSDGLEGQDDNLDILFPLFEQLQLATVEAADPHLDLITFATSAYYFGVIIEHHIPPTPVPEPVGDNENETVHRRNKPSPKAAKEKIKVDQLLKNLAKRKSKASKPPRIPPAHSFVPPGPAIPKSPKIDPEEYEFETALRHDMLSAKAAKDGALIDQLYGDLVKETGIERGPWIPSPPSSVPSRPAYPSTSTFATEGTPEFFAGFLKDEEETRPLEVISHAATVKNEWWKFGVSEAIDNNLPPESEKQAVKDELLGSQQNLWGEFESKIDWEADPKPGNSALPQPVFSLPWRRDKVIGMVYLTSSQNIEDPLHVGELNIGIILAEHARGKGHARRAIELVANKAFDKAKCHRLQAILLNHVAKDRALCLFTEMRFGHEGTRRRSFFSPMELEWKDVTYMAMLDTDWIMGKSRGASSAVRSAPKSLWDELFARHQREREELLRWESSTTLRRTSSMVTLRAASPIATAPPITSESEFDSEMSDSSSSARLSYSQKGKRKADAIERGSDAGYDGSTSDSEAELDPLNKKWKLSLPGSESPNPFTDEEGGNSPGGYESVTSWDALESSASSSDDMSDSGDSSMYDFIDDSH